MPTLEDDDFNLWESNVIVRYLCARHSAGGSVPQDLRTRFDAERWMDWQQTTLNGAGREAFVQLVRTPEGRSSQAIATSVAATEPLLTMLDAHLARRRFLAGDGSPWPISRSPARCTAGGACPCSIPSMPTCKAGTTASGRCPPRAASSNFP